jgi:YD repeat-containing protein
LLVDSADRRQFASPTYIGAEEDLPGFGVPAQPQNDFTIQKRQTFVSGFFNRIALTEVRIPFCAPNVNPRNNKVIVSTGSPVANYTITIPTGYYTPTELATELDAQLTADISGGGQTWAVAYDDQGAAFSIISNQAFSLIPYAYDTPAQTLKGLYFMMNFGANTNGTTLLGNPYPPMQYTNYIDICSRTLTQYQNVKDNSTRENQTPAVVARVYLNNFINENLGDGDTSAKLTWPGCRPQMVHRIYNVPKYSSWNPGAFVDQVDIQLRDDAGNLLYYADSQTPNVDDGGVYNSNDFQLTFHCSEN